MKKIGLTFCFGIFITTAFGQQFLWSTIKDTTSKYVPLDSVSSKVLEFYDHYEYYYDGAGYNKDGFVKSFEGSQSYKNSSTSGWKNFKKKIYEIKELAVFAIRVNSGHGSVVMVLCVSKENVNMIVFSNTYEKDAISIIPYEREKFAKWFKTLLE